MFAIESTSRELWISEISSAGRKPVPKSHYRQAQVAHRGQLNLRANKRNRASRRKGRDQDQERHPNPSPTHFIEDPLGRNPPSWKFASDQLRVRMFNRIIKQSAGKAFTLHLGPKGLPKVVRNPGQVLDHVHRRIKRHLDGTLGRNVDFCAVLEISPDGILHLHGAVAVVAEELDAAKTALRMAGGGRYKGRGSARDLDVSDLWGPDGWAAYALKDAKRLREAFPDHLDDDRLFTVTNGLRRDAKKLYRHYRDRLIAARRQFGTRRPRSSCRPSETTCRPLRASRPFGRRAGTTQPELSGCYRSALNLEGQGWRMRHIKRGLSLPSPADRRFIWSRPSLPLCRSRDPPRRKLPAKPDAESCLASGVSQ